nr:uncharacterized protein LOC112997308 [Dromaius novaehollandiae]
MESRMRQESRSCSENKLVKRNSSPVSEFSEQQSQDDPSGSFRLMQDIQTKMDSGSLLHSYATPWIPEAEQRGGADSVKDPEKQTDRNPECSISQLEACFDLSACPIKDIQDIESESGSSLLRSSSHQEMEKEKSGVKTSNSEKQFMREKEETFQPTESGKAAAGKSFGIDTGVAEIKATKSISHKLTKMDQTSKKQKISNKNKQYRKTEFVIDIMDSTFCPQKRSLLRVRAFNLDREPQPF